jgi:hypothetical protein
MALQQRMALPPRRRPARAFRPHPEVEKFLTNFLKVEGKGQDPPWSFSTAVNESVARFANLYKRDSRAGLE